MDLIDREKAVKEIEDTISAMMEWRVRNLDQEKGLYDAITIIEGLSSVKPKKDD